MAEDGVIKFKCNWCNEPLLIEVPVELKMWRDKMHQLKLIGEYTDSKIGYGNISVKTKEGILISGTQTGNIFPIQDQDFALITYYSMNENSVACKGEIKASAESLTHAAVYECDKTIQAIIHIHNKDLWSQLMDKVPTSNKSVPYGTAKMASEIRRLFNETSIAQDNIMVMGGHEEGIITFGTSLNEAGQVILKHLS